jgi:hypothetical protein
MPEVGKLLKNVYFDTAASPYLYEKTIFDFVSRLIGSGRILFGSDYPLISQNRIITQITDSNMSEKAKKKIFSDNAIELLAQLKTIDKTGIYKFD